jgi:hypothetical protein
MNFSSHGINKVSREEFLRFLKLPPSAIPLNEEKEGWERILRFALLPFKLQYALEEPSLRIPHI